MSYKLKPLSAVPPQNQKSNKKLEEFINQANDPNKSGTLNIVSLPSNLQEAFPWEQPHVRSDLKKLFNLRLSEKEFVKLEYLAKLKKESMHKLCLDILIPEINKELGIEK